MTEIFVYGTLEFPEVMQALTGRRFPARSAVLEHYRRARLEGLRFPAIGPQAGARTPGLLYSGIDSETVVRLDRFEGPLYERRLVQVRPTGGSLASAHAYVIAPAHRDLLGIEPWDRAGFAALHLEAYVAECEAFRDELGQPEAIGESHSVP